MLPPLLWQGAVLGDVKDGKEKGRKRGKVPGSLGPMMQQGKSPRIPIHHWFQLPFPRPLNFTIVGWWVGGKKLCIVAGLRIGWSNNLLSIIEMTDPQTSYWGYPWSKWKWDWLCFAVAEEHHQVVTRRMLPSCCSKDRRRCRLAFKCCNMLYRLFQPKNPPYVRFPTTHYCSSTDGITNTHRQRSWKKENSDRVSIRYIPLIMIAFWSDLYIGIETIF